MVTVQPVFVLLACWAISRSRQPVGATCWVRQVVRLGGFVATTGDFKQHASRDERRIGLGGGMFGDAGRHTRTTVGPSPSRWELPLRSRERFWMPNLDNS